jgi:hypothetical protein
MAPLVNAASSGDVDIEVPRTVAGVVEEVSAARRLKRRIGSRSKAPSAHPTESMTLLLAAWIALSEMSSISSFEAKSTNPVATVST